MVHLMTQERRTAPNDVLTYTMLVVPFRALTMPWICSACWRHRSL